MKKYILPLIIILILSFTLTVNCVDWLPGWDNRIELAIGDYAGDIGAAVTWFPVTVFLTATQGEEVFVELTTDAEYLKVAFTKADGTTELYGEMEIFDVSEELGIFHVSRDGWTINANTSIYMYYDADHANNTTYIGAINTTPGAAVWDGDFLAVYHMIDDAGGEIDDSTSNSNDGTKNSANNPIETDGKIGQAQLFTSDKITLPQIYTVNECDLTVECVARNQEGARYMVEQDIVEFLMQDQGTGWYQSFVGNTSVNTEMPEEAWRYCVTQYDGTDMKIYLDYSTTETDTSDGATWTGAATHIGDRADNQRPWTDKIDETRFSDAVRADAWIKGTYNSLWDTLLTYGSEEEAPLGNATFFGFNF